MEGIWEEERLSGEELYSTRLADELGINGSSMGIHDERHMSFLTPRENAFCQGEDSFILPADMFTVEGDENSSPLDKLSDKTSAPCLVSLSPQLAVKDLESPGFCLGFSVLFLNRLDWCAIKVGVENGPPLQFWLEKREQAIFLISRVQYHIRAKEPEGLLNVLSFFLEGVYPILLEIIEGILKDLKMLQDLIVAFDKLLEWICYCFRLNHFRLSIWCSTSSFATLRGVQVAERINIVQAGL
jgi:hypothetical protein